MAANDIIPFANANSVHMNGSLKFAVAAGATAINAGEPVQKLAGAATVTALLTNSPTTTNRIVGVALSASTQTASVAGTVDVAPALTGQIWLISPKVATGFTDSQTNYNTQIGKRVLIDLTAGVYTILAVDGASQGCIVEYNDLSRYPGKVAFSWSSVCNYLNV